MRLHLGSHLNYFNAQQRANLEIELVEKKRLEDILDRLKIPLREVFLDSINGKVVALGDAWIQSDDYVQLYPPMSGG